MAARGIHFAGSGNYASYIPGSTICDPTAADFTICGWMMITADSSSGSNRNCPFYLGDNSFHSAWFGCTDTTSPWVMESRANDGNEAFDSVDTALNPTNNASYFFAITYNHTGGVMKFYWAADGAGSLSTRTAVQTLWTNAMDRIRVGAAGDGTDAALTGDVTNLIVLTSEASSADLYSQMNSATLIGAFSGSCYEHWPLLNATDLTGAVNSRVLTVTGSASSGTMDPVDLQGAASSDVFFEGLQNLGNGFKAATAAGMQGVIVT